MVANFFDCMIACAILRSTLGANVERTVVRAVYHARVSLWAYSVRGLGSPLRLHGTVVAGL